MLKVNNAHIFIGKEGVVEGGTDRMVLGALRPRTQHPRLCPLSSALPSDGRVDPSLALGKVSWGDIKPAQLPAQAWQEVREWVDLSCWAPARPGRQPPGGSG